MSDQATRAARVQAAETKGAEQTSEAARLLEAVLVKMKNGGIERHEAQRVLWFARELALAAKIDID